MKYPYFTILSLTYINEDIQSVFLSIRFENGIVQILNSNVLPEHKKFGSKQ